MTNLVIFVLYTVLVLVSCILIILSLLILKPKQYIIGCVIAALFAIVLCITSSPKLIDLIEKKTNCFEGIYVTSSTTGLIGESELIFDVEGRKVVVYSANLERVPTKLHEGKLYKITYFVNTKIISTWELIE